MFTGHYGAAFGFKATNKRVPLWVLFLAVQGIDILWSVLTYLGIEKFTIVPGFLALSSLNFYYMPWTHGLDSALLWSLLATLVYRLLRKQDGWPAAWIVGAAVFSHWILDLLVHGPDLPLIGNQFKVGFGLWRFPVIGIAVELAVLLGGAALFLSSLPRQRGRAKYMIFALFLALLQVGMAMGPAPQNKHQMEIMALVFYFGVAAIAWALERKSKAKTSELAPAEPIL